MDRCLCLDIADRRLFYLNKIVMSFMNYGYKTIFVPGCILKKKKKKEKILENSQLTTLIQKLVLYGHFI